MADCAVYDVPCVANSFIDWLLGIWEDFTTWLFSSFNYIVSLINNLIDWLINGISAIFGFVVELYNMLAVTLSFLSGFLEIFEVNPTAGLIIATIMLIISLIIIIRIYNILADIEIFGWKLPRIPI